MGFGRLRGFGYEFEMFDRRRAGKEGADDGAPFCKGRRLAKSHVVVVQRVPQNLQDVALLALDAPVHLEALEALGVADDGDQAALYRFLKGGVLAWGNADVGKFKNHRGVTPG
jgi:hypothetical protein